MVKKISKKIKQIIKENFKFFIIFFILLFTLTYEFPYYIETPGGTIDIATRIKIENGYESQGSFHMAYVSEMKATIPTLLIAQFQKDWDIIKKSEVVQENEEANDVYKRDRLMLEEANQTAILVAFEKAGKTVEIKEAHLYITYIDPLAQTNLKVGDEIVTVNGTSIHTKSELNRIIQSYEIGDTLQFTVLQDGKEISKEAKIINYENKKLIGLMLTESMDITTDPKIEFQFKSSESGASGGLMMTLAIYNSLVKDDITKGKKIVGTGTIDKDGNVGQIDGVKYKLKGAENTKADLFFVPNGENYEEAIQLKDDLDYEIEVVGVDTLDDALEYLEQYVD